ncbi:MAG: class I SAM-dependent RNA methyltransferase, partial [Defluviitaleaceae bacterium]|nr:class I SAM-dependent RNA methyltransferase [Defluviitaleaceae bacterium]
SDIDKKMIHEAKEHAKLAGVDEYIQFSTADITKKGLPCEYGILMTNPPYGQRIGDFEAMLEIYKSLKNLIPKTSTWSLYVITSDESFEQHFGRKANAKRKLFNGATKTDFYQYYGPKPPR